MMPACTARKVGLIKIALELALRGEAPTWDIPDPMRAFKDVSRDESRQYKVELKGRNWTTAYEILDSYLCAYDSILGEDEADPELLSLMHKCNELLVGLREGFDMRQHIDWAAKEYLLRQYVEAEGVQWDHPSLRSFDLEYTNVDPAESLFYAVAEEGIGEPLPSSEDLESRLETVFEPTRALARGLAVSKFSDRLLGVSWASLTFRGGHEPLEVYLPPDKEYGAQLQAAESVESLIEQI